MYRSPHLRWLLMLVLLWQGVAAASMVPQMRMTMPPASVAALPPCHMTDMAGDAVPQPAHAVLESCCDHADCAWAALCAACILPMHVGVSLPSPLGAGPLPPPVADDVAASASHPFRPPIL